LGWIFWVVKRYIGEGQGQFLIFLTKDFFKLKEDSLEVLTYKDLHEMIMTARKATLFYSSLLPQNFFKTEEELKIFSKTDIANELRDNMLPIQKELQELLNEIP